MAEQRGPVDLARARWMGAFFASGAICFAVGPASPYVALAGQGADQFTFFAGSVLFTLGGLVQCWLAWHERRSSVAGRATWRTAWVQSIGTVLFNFMTLQAIGTVPSGPHYDLLVWQPNALGSICFLISGALFYVSSPRRGWLPQRRHLGWWEPSVNLLGCALFGISAVAGLAVSSPGALLSAGIAGWTTSLGAVCFLACAVAALSLGHTLKAPRLRRLRSVALELERVGAVAGSDAARLARAAEAEFRQVRESRAGT